MAKIERGFLVGRECERLGRQKHLAAKRVAFLDVVAQDDVALRGESFDGGGIGMGELGKFRHEHAFGLVQHLDDAPGFGAQLGELVRRNLAGTDELALFPTDLRLANDFRQRAFHTEFDRAAVVPAHPAREFENPVIEQRFRADDLAEVLELRIRRRICNADDVALRVPSAKRDGHARTDVDRGRQMRWNAIIKFPVKREIDNDLGDGLTHVASY